MLQNAMLGFGMRCLTNSHSCDGQVYTHFWQHVVYHVSFRDILYRVSFIFFSDITTAFTNPTHKHLHPKSSPQQSQTKISIIYIAVTLEYFQTQDNSYLL